MELVETLKKVLASNFALYLKAHNFHWNVEGMSFKQFHDFFGGLYEEWFDVLDKWAEEIRALNQYAPGTLDRYRELSIIGGEDRILKDIEMVRILANDNKDFLNLLHQAYQSADDAGELGLANFVQDRIDIHKKQQWMLNSFLKG